MPCLAALVAGGTSGELTSFAPYLSPIVWTTIATGHHPDRHGVQGFAAVDEATGEARATGSGMRRTKALWNIVSEQGRTASVVGWMASFPAEAIHGAVVADPFGHAPSDLSTPWPVPKGSVYPPELAGELADIRLRPQDVDTGLLGLFFPGMDARDARADPYAGRLLQRLAQLYTLHNAAVVLIERGQTDFFTVYFHFLDLICHEFVMYHPPRHPHVRTADYARYRDVVSAAYRVQDALLGDLLRHCEPGTGVMLVSDHGFTTGMARPSHMPRSEGELTSWHAREGILVAKGPGVVSGGRFCGVRPLDVAPTLLAWLGLPRGADMPGRVLAEMFTEAPAEAVVTSWESEPPTRSGPMGVAENVEADEQTRLIRRFIELGYLDPAVEKGRGGGERVADENRFNTGMALRDLGRSVDALPWLHTAALSEPESARRSLELTQCLLDLGLPEEAERAAQAFFDQWGQRPRAQLLRVRLLIARRRFTEALASLDELGAAVPRKESGRLRRLALLQAGRWVEARTEFTTEIKTGPRSVMLHLGLAHACLWLGRLDEAAVAVRQALEWDRSSVFGRALLEDVLRAQSSGEPPRPPGWDVLANGARRRRELGRQMRERECLRDEARAAQSLRVMASETTMTVDNRKSVIVVSGAPRSGTSMMMRMLAMAGVPMLTDGVRVANADNPLGYFEWEPVKRLGAEPGLIARAEGKAVKIISALLPFLPDGWSYDLIFMRREGAAILRSQDRMLEHGESGGSGESVTGRLRLEADELDRHIAQTLVWVRNDPRIRVLEVNYDEMLEHPQEGVARLVEFIGAGRIKRPEALRTAIRVELRHEISGGAPNVSVDGGVL